MPGLYYVGVSSESISFPNRSAAEVDLYGGIRPTIGMFAFDVGAVEWAGTDGRFLTGDG